jgi:hypothetical protein
VSGAFSLSIEGEKAVNGARFLLKRGPIVKERRYLSVGRVVGPTHMILLMDREIQVVAKN